MKAEYINPFLEAVNYVLQEVIPGINIKRLPLAKVQTPISTRGCSSLIGVTGDVDGRVVLDMEREVAIVLASAMAQETYTQFDTNVSSAINELTNMLCGHAITNLNNSGKKLDISAPTLIIGKDVVLYDSMIVGEAILITLETTYGIIYVNIAMTD